MLTTVQQHGPTVHYRLNAEVPAGQALSPSTAVQCDAVTWVRVEGAPVAGEFLARCQLMLGHRGECHDPDLACAWAA